MLKINLTKDDGLPYKLLFLGAHSDDIEIGCGGSILKLLKNYHETEVHWIVFSSNGSRASEAVESAGLFLANATRKKVFTEKFKESYFPYVGSQIKEYFERLKIEFTPDIIFTHCRHDLHQDHRLINELTWNTFRHHLILEYEIIKYDGDLGNPNLFVHLDEHTSNSKIEYVLKSFDSQKGRRWFREDVFRSVLSLRGVESNAPDGYAEGFYVRKAVL